MGRGLAELVSARSYGAAMADLDALLDANRRYARSFASLPEPRPSRHVAAVTCMDTRLDVGGALGLGNGEAHILRNAGARVTDDVLRSLALSAKVLEVDAVVLMQHTRCGLAGVTDAQLRFVTDADIDFAAIRDHAEALEHDIEVIAGTPFLDSVRTVAGWRFDVDNGTVEELHRRQRP